MALPVASAIPIPGGVPQIAAPFTGGSGMPQATAVFTGDGSGIPHAAAIFSGGAVPVKSTRSVLSHGKAVVPLEDAARAVESAIQLTSAAYESEIKDINAFFLKDAERRRKENRELRALASELEDELQWYREELAESLAQVELVRRESEALARESTNAQNFTAVLRAKEQLSKEVHERQRLEGQLSKLSGQLAEAHHRLQEYANSGVVGERLTAKGNELREKMNTRAGASEVMRLEWEIDQNTEKELEVGRRVNQLAAHIEREIFGAGAGDINRTQLLVLALLDRPALRALLGKHAPTSQKAISVAAAMLENARGVLNELSAKDQKDGRRGTRTAADHLKFETILFSLLPDNAKDEQMLATIGDLLGVHWEQLNRSWKRKCLCNKDDSKDAITRSFCMKRKRRSDFRDAGRALCSNFWHARTRLDTNLGHKKRQRVITFDGRIDYIEHWRHEQFDTNAQMAEQFFESCEYAAYRAAGVPAFSKD
eukprot:1963111-Prymnesium_polylepis.1